MFQGVVWCIVNPQWLWDHSKEENEKVGNGPHEPRSYASNQL